MRPRNEVARFVERQFDAYGGYDCQLEKGNKHHYGKQEVRELLDFIYGSPPTTNNDMVRGKALRNRRIA